MGEYDVHALIISIIVAGAVIASLRFNFISNQKSQNATYAKLSIETINQLTRLEDKLLNSKTNIEF